MTELQVSPVEIAASVSVSRIDGVLFTKEEVDTLVMELHDKVWEFVDAYGGTEKYNFAVGNTRSVNLEPDVEEVQAAVHELGELAVQAEIDADDDDDVEVGTEEEDGESSFDGPATKTCTACHVATTQMDVNQCPMCGNPFLP